jgi:hypothetical protein
MEVMLHSARGQRAEWTDEVWQQHFNASTKKQGRGEDIPLLGLFK